MKFSEKFNQHKLNYILNNKEQFKCRVYEESYDPFNLPNKYLQLSSHGIVNTSYHQVGGRSFGRMFANDVSLQGICREIRHTIAGEFYTDLDIINCHPVILLWLCNKHDIVCDRLTEYVSNRDEFINELVELNKDSGVDADKVKEIFLSLINGGYTSYNELKHKSKFIKRFRTETIDILDEMCLKYPKEYEYRLISNPLNPKGSTVNSIMCNVENEILMNILEFYKNQSLIFDNCALCFDGIMMPKNDEAIQNLIPDCETYIKTKIGISIGLKIKPMDKGFEIPIDIPLYLEYKAFDVKDPFCWLEFDRKWRGHTFNSRDDIIKQTRIDLNRVFCNVEQGCGFIVRKTNCEDYLMDIIDSNSTFTSLYVNYHDDDKVKELSFKQYLKYFSNSINTYKYIDFIPNSQDTQLFNLWSGFQASSTNVEIDEIQLILNHIKEVYCNNDDVSYDYFLDLLYYIIKYPEKPLGVATFIYSKKQGSGKNVLLDFLQDYVFGKNITHYTCGLDSVLEKHNHLMKNKKVIIVDELASSQDTFINNFDRLKSMMTGSHLVINPKGVNQMAIRNVLCMFLLSNHTGIHLEPTDRRYFCLKVCEKYVGDISYFKKLTQTFSQRTGDIFYSYILQRGDSREINIRVPPMNEFKREIIGAGFNSSIRFLMELVEPTELNELDNTTEITATELYEKYRIWCGNNHEKLKSSTKFFMDIKDNITKKRLKSGMVYDLTTIQSK
jgi:hypothetical protein